MPRASTRRPRRRVSAPPAGRSSSGTSVTFSRCADSARSCHDPRMTTPPATPPATPAAPSALERARLADALEAAGPDAPTLCTGWTARDLAAHLAARRRGLDSPPGLLLRPRAGWTEHVRAGYARRPYPELLHLIRTGPPATSPFALPGADAAGN